MVSGYGQFCPVALAAEVLAERWTPLIVRELLCGGTRFNELHRGLPRMPVSTLTQRLKKLQQAGIVLRRDDAGGPAYLLTPAGRALFPVIEAMGIWSQHWLRHEMVADRNLDPDLLMWDIRRNVRHPPQGPGRKVIEFRLAGVPPRKQRYWLLRQAEGVDLCYRDPGFAVDLSVRTSVRILTSIWLGHLPLARARSEHSLILDGAPPEQRDFARWFALSTFAAAALSADPPAAGAAPAPT